MSEPDEQTYAACEAGPPGDTPTPADRHNRRWVAQKLAAWAQQNAHRYPSAQAMKADACQFVLETVILGAVLTAIIEWIVERVLNHIFRGGN